MLADGDDEVVDMELLRLGFAIDVDWRGVDGAREARRMQLQSLHFAVAEYSGHCETMLQFDTFFKHVVEIFGDSWHFLFLAFDRDHGHFHSTLPQRFAGTVDGGVSAADDRDAGTYLN